MQIFYIQQALMSANVRTVIKDTEGSVTYLLVGRWGIKGDSLSVYNLNGDLLASARQRSYALNQQFDLIKKHHIVGKLSRLISYPKDVYVVKKLKWVILGNQRGQYRVYYLNHQVMSIDKVSFKNKESYKITVVDEEYTEICLCIAAILDYWARVGETNQYFNMDGAIVPEF
ncbi:LURP-one-related/scramblase family protein [Vagococcus vulneris]|uniref:LURP-one-related family protein n=1 Tax=Vagococcus vulneris TaxID=1977869 RepID=A0A430A0C2_9ENTE|nr:hypothetical protein [Vagococcus vulneris]RST99783.1 hypothetical protein CBF37_03400 [Vagococcus vulneris]